LRIGVPPGAAKACAKVNAIFDAEPRHLALQRRQDFRRRDLSMSMSHAAKGSLPTVFGLTLPKSRPKIAHRTQRPFGIFLAQQAGRHVLAFWCAHGIHIKEMRSRPHVITRRRFLTNTTAALAAAGVHPSLWARALREARMPEAAPPGVPLLIGVDYYPDQTPESLWEQDARKIAEVGFTNVRVAEFAWALMEPSEGKFDLAWLRRSVQMLQKHDIPVILGTPSAAPPPWLTAKYPDVLLVNDQGMTVQPGGRRFTCPTNQTYRRLSLTVATEMARAFADTPGIIGWQIDNEFILQRWGRCYCKYCRAGFQQWLRDKYGNLDKINREWGTSFWSQVYTEFSQIPVPLASNGDPNPGLALDYDRYQSFANASFLEEQLAMLRKTCPKHFVTTNNVGGLVDTIDLRDLYRNLDFVSHDNYPGFFQIIVPEPMPSEVVATSVALGHDFMRSVKGGKPFLVMEEQTGKAGQPFFSPQPYKGQIRLWTYQAIAHGAMGINYFRWDTANFGAEEYWHGMLAHDRSKSPGFDEIAQTVRELKKLGPDVLNASYPADVALCFDSESDWAVAIQPGHNKLSYLAGVTSWYAAISSAHAATDIINAEADLSRYKAVFAPLHYVLSEKQAVNIRTFVERGGVFVAGFRLGVKDESSQIVGTPLPGLLRDVMGATVKDYVPLYNEKVAVKFASPLTGADGGSGLWADVLQPSTASVIATYANGRYPGDPAITINTFGKGKAVYVGPDLDPASLTRVVAALLGNAGIKPLDLPKGVERTVRKSGSIQWVFLLNHTAAPQVVTLVGQHKDMLTNTAHTGKVTLAPYDVLVVQAP
jgi:beta-galactosidase